MESEIIINGHRLTDAQAMTVRVALNGLVADMAKEGALGTDAHAKCMSEAYVDRGREVLRRIHST